MHEITINVSPYQDENRRTLLKMKTAEVVSLALAAETGCSPYWNYCLLPAARQRHAAEYKRIMKFSHKYREKVQRALEKSIDMTYEQLAEVTIRP